MSNEIGRKVRRPSNDDGSMQPEVSTPGFVSNYPDLADFLIKSRGSGQTPSTGTITLFLEQGRFKLCLNDRPLSRSTFVSGGTLFEALANADAGIRGKRLKWRTKGYRTPQNAQKPLNYA